MNQGHGVESIYFDGGKGGEYTARERGEGWLKSLATFKKEESKAEKKRGSN